MLTLGIAGGLDPVFENLYDSPQNFTYDAACVLVEDGEVVAALEEERPSRVKRTNKFPFQAIRRCLEVRGVALSDVDRVAYYVAEEHGDALLARLRSVFPALAQVPDARSLLWGALARELGVALDPAKIAFVPHKLTHAMSAFATSGHGAGLVVVLDNEGGVFAGSAGAGAPALEPLAAFPPSKSLGELCNRVIQLLGYGWPDEAEAMELAAGGDASVYRPLLRSFYALLPEGDYDLHLAAVAALFDKVPLRRKGEPLAQAHKDLVAALQEALEDIVFHVLRHHRARSGLGQLSLAGGASQNCALNSKILASGLFDDVFVLPAAHDAGCALGAALCAQAGAPARTGRLQHVFWGTDVGSPERVAAELSAWSRFVSFEPAASSGPTAALLAEGAILGWARGRSELGLKTLGHRSILADPRSPRSRERLNRIKGRAPHRPLGICVLEEDARELFVLPCAPEALRFKSFAFEVRPSARGPLAAALHEDGTVRPQTVSRATDPALAGLLVAFKEATGIGALLCSSLDDEAEPMAESVEDAIATALALELDGLVVGDAIVRRRAITAEDKLSLAVALPRYVRLSKIRGFVDASRLGTRHELRTTVDGRFSRPISEAAYRVLDAADGQRTAAELIAGWGLGGADAARLAEELWELWVQRLVALRPARTTR